MKTCEWDEAPPTSLAQIHSLKCKSEEYSFLLESLELLEGGWPLGYFCNYLETLNKNNGADKVTLVPEKNLHADRVPPRGTRPHIGAIQTCFGLPRFVRGKFCTKHVWTTQMRRLVPRGNTRSAYKFFSSNYNSYFTNFSKKLFISLEDVKQIFRTQGQSNV